MNLYKCPDKFHILFIKTGHSGECIVANMQTSNAQRRFLIEKIAGYQVEPFWLCRDVSWLELRVCLCNIWRPSHRGQEEDIGSEGRGCPQSDNLSPSPPDCPFPHFLHFPRRPCGPFVGKQINLLKRNCFSVIDQLYCHIQDSRFTYKWSIPPAPAKDVWNHSLLSSANRYEYTGSSSDHCHVRCK